MLHYGCFLVTNLCIGYVFNGAILWLVVNKNLMHKLIEGFTSYWCNPVQRNKLYQSLGDADSSCLLDCWYWGCAGKKRNKMSYNGCCGIYCVDSHTITIWQLIVFGSEDANVLPSTNDNVLYILDVFTFRWIHTVLSCICFHSVGFLSFYIGSNLVLSLSYSTVLCLLLFILYSCLLRF